ncbi:MAG: winged helix-turn-helix domain-containing protein [Rhodothermales bacterium]
MPNASHLSADSSRLPSHAPTTRYAHGATISTLAASGLVPREKSRRHAPGDWLRAGTIWLNRRYRQVLVDHVPIRLRRREFELLEHFMRSPGQCFSRDELLADVWGIHFDTGTNVVDAQVYSLRLKLKTVGVSQAIETVRGVGYKLKPELPPR